MKHIIEDLENLRRCTPEQAESIISGTISFLKAIHQTNEAEEKISRISEAELRRFLKHYETSYGPYKHLTCKQILDESCDELQNLWQGWISSKFEEFEQIRAAAGVTRKKAE